MVTVDQCRQLLGAVHPRPEVVLHRAQGGYGAWVWVWAVVCAVVIVLCVLTTPTCRALMWPLYRYSSIMVAGVVVADHVRDQWREANADQRQRLAWAYYQLLGRGRLHHGLSFAEFRRHRRVVLAASVVIGRRWQVLADRRFPRGWYGDVAEIMQDLLFRLRLLLLPSLLLGRSGRGRLPRLPVRSRLRGVNPRDNRRWRYQYEWALCLLR